MKESLTFKSFFFYHQKKKKTGFPLNILETPTPVYRGASVLYFDAPFFCCLLFFEDISTLRLLESTKW